MKPQFHHPLASSIVAGLLAIAPAPAATTHYVDLGNPTPASPYTNWFTAATNIQDAIDTAGPGDLVLVTNGVYQAGGAQDSQLTYSRVALTKPLTVQSVNGPAATLILGSPGSHPPSPFPVRCACLTNGAALVGFTLTNGTANGSSPTYGGGVYGLPAPVHTGVVSNCVLTGNVADVGGGAAGVLLYHCLLTGNSASSGGGAYMCTLNNCVVTGNTASGSSPYVPSPGSGAGSFLCTMTNCLVVRNSASNSGGGVCAGRLVNCTIVSNTAASYGGGVYSNAYTALTNCIVFNNSAATGPNYQPAALFSHSCTTPLPAGSGNFTNDPAFANLAAGDFHPQTNSPCINAGISSAVSSATDLDGNPRITGGTVDIGAYELQTPASTISYAWLQQYGLPTDGTADALDTDSDGMANWQEWRAGTNPTNAASALRITSVSAKGAVATLRWQSVSGITYSLEHSANLLVQPAFLPLQTNIAGTGGQVTVSHTNSTPESPAFYRLSIQ